MGCGSSQPEQPPRPPPGGGGGNPNGNKPAGVADSRNIDSDLKRAKQEEEGKIKMCYKMLVLGAAESGKSTLFKQMRLLYGTERSVDGLRMCSVVARSNTIVAVRKLCSNFRNRNISLDEELDREARPGV